MASIESRRGRTGTTHRVVWRDQGRKCHSPTFDTVGEAERYRAIMAGDRARGVYLDPARPRTRFADYAKCWFELRPKTAEQTPRASKERSHLDARLLPYWGSWELGALENSHVRGWVNELCRPTTASTRTGPPIWPRWPWTPAVLVVLPRDPDEPLPQASRGPPPGSCRC